MPMTTKYVSEIDVIIATALWLHSNNYMIQVISIPKGEGIDIAADRQKLMGKLAEKGIPLESIRFESKGPDIIASFDSGIWKIECKGLGKGAEGTLRENFTRTLASTVSYFDSKENLRLGLAMPKHDTYINLISSKIPRALREVLNLWIFIYNPEINTIDIYDPISKVPSKYDDIIEL